MKRIMCLVIIVLACALPPCLAQSMGTMTEKGVSMNVKAAVAIFNPDGSSLRFVLLPFQPTAEEVAQLQKDETMWLLDQKTVDAKKWPAWCPYGSFQLSWFDKTSVGDTKKASILIYTYGIGKGGSNINLNKPGDTIPVTLTG